MLPWFWGCEIWVKSLGVWSHIFSFLISSLETFWGPMIICRNDVERKANVRLCWVYLGYLGYLAKLVLNWYLRCLRISPEFCDVQARWRASWRITAPQILNEEDARWPYMAGDMDPQWFHEVHETANRWYQLQLCLFRSGEWKICPQTPCRIM